MSKNLMIQTVLVKSIDDVIEEEVGIQVGELSLTCFASYCPYEIQEEHSYPAELSFFESEDGGFRVVDDATVTMAVRVDGGFAYDVTGVVRGPCLEVRGVLFDIEEWLHGLDGLSGYDGRKVCIRVARIDIGFQ